MADYTIDVLARAISVLDYLSESRRPRALAQICAGVGLDKSRTFRILETLRASEYVERNDTDKTYVLGLGAARLRVSSPYDLDLPRLAMPSMRKLSASLQDSISMGVLDGSYVRYVARVQFRRIINSHIEVGTLLPAHATSMGKVLLSALPPQDVAAIYQDVALLPFTENTIDSVADLLQHLVQVRADDYATTDEELELLLLGAAMPIYAPEGSMLAAINVSYPASRRRPLTEILPRLQECAESISKDLARI